MAQAGSENKTQFLAMNRLTFTIWQLCYPNSYQQQQQQQQQPPQQQRYSLIPRDSPSTVIALGIPAGSASDLNGGRRGVEPNDSVGGGR